MAEETAMEWVALPGTSEHQLGISVDINADTSKCSRDDVVMMFITGYLKTLINMDLSKGILQGKQVLQEWSMNRGIIAM